DFAQRLRITHEAAIGLLVQLWLELPDHARDGAIGQITDQALEEWAGWRGRRGRFAPAYRDLFQTVDGKVNAWDRHNGKALEKSDRDAERTRRWREEQAKLHAEQPHTVHVPERVRERTRKRALNANGTRCETGNETDERPSPPSHPSENSPGVANAP